MRKIYFFLILIGIILFPINVKAKYTYIDNYYMDITAKENGDFLVREFFIYKGSFNGAYRTIYYDSIGDYSDLFIDKNLYNPTNVNLIKIKEIPVDDDVNFNYINHEGTDFTYNEDAVIGNSGYYDIINDNKKITYKVFAPGETKGFYIEYLLKDVVVTHNDVSEVWLNLFRSNPDDIKNLEIMLNLPDNKDTLRAWAHGPLTGNINIINNQKVKFTVSNLSNGGSLDIRLAFDANLNVVKKTNTEALNKITDVETRYADKVNLEREKARQELERQEKRKELQGRIFNILGVLWIFGLIFLIKFVYRNYDKEHISTFKGKYFRDIPSDYSPATVSYLLDKHISNKDLSACILYLIYDKVIEFESINKKDYKFKYVNKEKELSNCDKLLIELLFNGKDEITLSEFKKRAKNDYQPFLKDYNAWYEKATNVAKNEDFFESKVSIKIYSVLYAVLGLTTLFLCNEYANTYLVVALGILGISSLIYFATFYKRTIKGNEEYLKWIGLKNFMNDFGKMDIKDLPEIILWEKYLVYAVTLGCAEKLSKTMKIRISEFNNQSYDHNLFDTRMMTVISLNSVVSHTVNSAMSSAKSVAASSNSSGSGFGGGFSSGGGFSGGGGGSTGHF